jgi:hypothetical protein
MEISELSNLLPLLDHLLSVDFVKIELLVDPGYALIVVLFLSSPPPSELSLENLRENGEELKRLRLLALASGLVSTDPNKVGDAELSDLLEGSQLVTG